ncbi:MAG: M15 family metallopeptidase [Clostridia bacterium]|nr:M15 family metallopeptidase [Clostridia bacterium]
MKKAIVIILSLVLALSMFAACTKSGGDPSPSENAPAENTTAADVPAWKTIGEALAAEKDESSEQSAIYAKVFVYVFEKDGTYWRLTAELSDEESAALSALDILDEDYAEKEKALITPLAVTKCESLNELKLSDEDLAALVGKTGKELLDDGWNTGMGYNLDSMEFYWEHGPFAYTVTFEKQEDLENTDDFDETAAVAELKVASVKFDGLGNTCTDISEYFDDEEQDAAIDYLVLVNKQNKLPDDWEETVDLAEGTNSLDETYLVERKALAQFELLRADLLKDGIDIELDSTYRSVKRQQEIWDEFEAEKGLEYAQTYVAVPGYSEHHTGLAIDVCLIKDGVVISDNDDMIAEKEIFAEIHKRLADYGFILRYLEGKEDVTGYGYEPWHFRYIDSPEIAHEIMDGGLTLEEYLGAVPDTTE